MFSPDLRQAHETDGVFPRARPSIRLGRKFHRSSLLAAGGVSGLRAIARQSGHFQISSHRDEAARRNLQGDWQLAASAVPRQPQWPYSPNVDHSLHRLDRTQEIDAFAFDADQTHNAMIRGDIRAIGLLVRNAGSGVLIRLGQLIANARTDNLELK